jgi:hypothetical protein
MNYELEQFIDRAKANGSSDNTISAYKNRYKKLIKLCDVENFHDIEDDELLEKLNEIKVANTRKALLNLLIILRESLYRYDVSLLRETRDNTNQLVAEQKKESNAKLLEDLPSYESLLEHMEELYDQKQYREYLIMYILTNYYTRNYDMVLDIVTKKSDMTDFKKNYIWLVKGKNKAIYLRNNYKTAKTYGYKEHTITDEKALHAIKMLKGQKLIDSSNPAYFVKNTTGGLGEGRVVKIIIDHYRKLGDLQKIQEIATSRGTDLRTIIESYDITLLPNEPDDGPDEPDDE